MKRIHQKDTLWFQLGTCSWAIILEALDSKRNLTSLFKLCATTLLFFTEETWQQLP